MKPVAYVCARFTATIGAVEVYGADLLPDDFEAAMAAARLAAPRWADRAPSGGSQTLHISQPARSAAMEAPVSGGALRDRVKLYTRAAHGAARAVLQGRGYTVRRHA